VRVDPITFVAAVIGTVLVADKVLGSNKPCRLCRGSGQNYYQPSVSSGRPGYYITCQRCKGSRKD
jgi:DnaJ-class molecular chaperone